MKISPTLAKLLNDTQYEEYEELTDSQVSNLSLELEMTQAELAKNLEDAGTISSSIEEIEESKKDLEIGLQSDINSTSARLLLSGLNRNIRKLESGAAIETAGLQSDDKNTILKAGLQAADGILNKAWEALKDLFKKIKAKLHEIFSKILPLFSNLKKEAVDLKNKFKNKDKSKAGNQSDIKGPFLTGEDSDSYINRFATVMYIMDASNIFELRGYLMDFMNDSYVAMPEHAGSGKIHMNDRADVRLVDNFRSKKMDKLLGLDENPLEDEIDDIKDLKTRVTPIVIYGKFISGFGHYSGVSRDIKSANGGISTTRYAKAELPNNIVAKLKDDYRDKIEILDDSRIDDLLNFTIKSIDNFKSYSSQVWKYTEDFEKDSLSFMKSNKMLDQKPEDEKHKSHNSLIYLNKSFIKIAMDMSRVAIDLTNQYQTVNKNFLWYCARVYELKNK